MVRNRAWPASSRLTVSRRMAGFGLGNLPPFPRVRGRFFSLFIYTFFMWYNSTGWNCPPSAPPPTICDFGANCAPCKGNAGFLLQNGVVLQKTQLGYVLANINLSSLERKERFRGKRGLVTDGRQTAHSRLDGAKLGSGIISCISLTLATLCQMAATCAHGGTGGKTGGRCMAESAVEDVPEWVRMTD